MQVLSAITNLKKLCNHPKLIYDAIHAKHDKSDDINGFKAREVGWEGRAAV